jgi:Catalytic LigB subunit of aromatic ring-opening dioxygenase
VADIVFGAASSHTPQLSSGVDMWEDHAARDRRNALLLGTDAEYHTYDELLTLADPAIEKELRPEIWAAKYVRAQEAVTELTRRLGEAAPDAAIVIGDDQREIFRDEGIPAIGCYLGDELLDLPPDPETADRIPAGIRAASWAAHSPTPEAHRVHADLSRHILETLVDYDFDMTCFTEQPAGRSLGHAFTFPRYRLGLSADTPIVPIFVNTYYPPNVPSAARGYALGRAIARAVRTWPGDERVAVIASGGLSHFVVNEALDQRVLDALTRGDADGLRCLRRAELRSGNSEILNWVVAAGALEDHTATVLDYVPGYRTPAGTGAGMAFAAWK